MDYIGTSKVRAGGVRRKHYNQIRGWETPADENPDDWGYLVESPDSPPNHKDYLGYITWMPRDVFDATYRLTRMMTFGHAIDMLKSGHRVARKGWNGKGMWLQLQPGGESNLPDGGFYEALPFIVMKTADDKIVPWLASQTDILAEDWRLDPEPGLYTEDVDMDISEMTDTEILAFAKGIRVGEIS